MECSSLNLTGGLLICDRQQTDTFLNIDNRRSHHFALFVRLLGDFERNDDFSPTT